jgi:dTMP kinase
MIALVGVDGSGRSTQARALARWLTARGVPATYVEHAGGRPRRPGCRRAVRAGYAILPRPAVVCFLATSPEVAQRRVAARGIDTEELAHLRALDAAYRVLPDFPWFVLLDGDADPEEVAAALDRAVSPLVAG